MAANEKQVGGNHYKMPGHEEHWDRAWRLRYDPFQYIVTKWLERWRKKNGIEDLRKAHHALGKYIELLEQGGDPYAERVPAGTNPAPEDGAEPGRGYVDQDRGSPATSWGPVAPAKPGPTYLKADYSGVWPEYPEPGALRRKAVAKRKKRKAAKR